MAIDLFASVRSTALVTLVAASFTSPILVKSDVVANASAKLSDITSGPKAPETEPLVAGGVAFAKPVAWGVLGSSSARGAQETDDTERVGTVVSGICPGGSSGSTCKDGVRVTFVAYAGGKDGSLPSLLSFRRQLDEELASEFAGFKAGDVRQLAGADSTPYLDYRFTYRDGARRRSQRIAAYRHGSGSGVVVLATGPKLAKHDKGLSEFLASAHEPGAGDA